MLKIYKILLSIVICTTGVNSMVWWDNNDINSNYESLLHSDEDSIPSYSLNYNESDLNKIDNIINQPIALIQLQDGNLKNNAHNIISTDSIPENNIKINNNIFNNEIPINNDINNNKTFLNKKRFNDKNNEKDQVIDSKKLINDNLDNPSENLDENKIMKSEKKNEHIIGNNNSVNIENNKLDNDKQIINQNSNVKQTIELDENNNINMTDKINNPLFNKKINNKILGLSFFDFYKRCGNKGNAIHKDIKQIFLDHPLFFSDYPGVTIYNYEKNKKAKQRMKELYKCYEKAIKQVLLSNNIQSSSAKYFKKG